MLPPLTVDAMKVLVLTVDSFPVVAVVEELVVLLDADIPAGLAAAGLAPQPHGMRPSMALAQFPIARGGRVRARRPAVRDGEAAGDPAATNRPEQSAPRSSNPAGRGSKQARGRRSQGGEGKVERSGEEGGRKLCWGDDDDEGEEEPPASEEGGGSCSTQFLDF